MIEIDDAAVERGMRKACDIGQSLTLDESGLRDILQAALDNRVGEADRRKVRTPGCELTRRVAQYGRRSTDITYYLSLPLATPPKPEIHNTEWRILQMSESLACAVHRFYQPDRPSFEWKVAVREMIKDTMRDLTRPINSHKRKTDEVDALPYKHRRSTDHDDFGRGLMNK